MTKRTAQSLAAEARFLDWADRNGYKLHAFEWTGARSRYAATCGHGHACQPMPNKVDAGESGCVPCGIRQRAQAKTAPMRQRFLDWALDNGYTLHGFEWRGVMATYPATCPWGHPCSPCPNRIEAGQGGCWGCAGRAWDAFYIVTGGGVLKFGITAGDARVRLAAHRRDGLGDVVLVRLGLAGSYALDLEREVRRLLDLAGVQPVRGREYFPVATRNMVLAVAEEWLGV